MRATSLRRRHHGRANSFAEAQSSATDVHFTNFERCKVLLQDEDPTGPRRAGTAPVGVGVRERIFFVRIIAGALFLAPQSE